MGVRKALVVGIDHYADPHANLRGAVIDARNVHGLLARHEDNSVNFDSSLLTSESSHLIGTSVLKDQIRTLFSGKGEIALFYFAGHGSTEDTGGYICPSDSLTSDDGISVDNIMLWANKSKFHNRIVILDSCFSGSLGTRPATGSVAEIQEGTTVLTASTDIQTAGDTSNGGVFTNLLVDALSGAACNLLGEITPGAVYAHIDQSLGTWGQRPMFKTNVERFVSLRSVQPPIETAKLRRILEFFPSRDFFFQLDPTFEPHRSSDEAHLPPPDVVNTAIFAILQEYNRVGLLKPEDAPHMWHAAMESKGAKLTRLGEYYRSLVERNKL